MNTERHPFTPFLPDGFSMVGLQESASVIDLLVGSSFMSPITNTLHFLLARSSESFTARTCLPATSLASAAPL